MTPVPTIGATAFEPIHPGRRRVSATRRTGGRHPPPARPSGPPGSDTPRASGSRRGGRLPAGRRPHPLTSQGDGESEAKGLHTDEHALSNSPRVDSARTYTCPPLVPGSLESWTDSPYFCGSLDAGPAAPARYVRSPHRPYRSRERRLSRRHRAHRAADDDHVADAQIGSREAIRIGRVGRRVGPP